MTGVSLVRLMLPGISPNVMQKKEVGDHSVKAVKASSYALSRHKDQKTTLSMCIFQ